MRFILVAGSSTPSHGVDVSGELAAARDRVTARPRAVHQRSRAAPRFDPAPFLTWFAAQGGAALGVDSAVLFDVHWLVPPGPPPWVAAGA